MVTRVRALRRKSLGLEPVINEAIVTAVIATELASCTAVELFRGFSTSDSSLPLSSKHTQKIAAESAKS